ncbi:PhzF family phenazine biosynthesis protein [Oryzobacter telluris]|uniref:PhzF family phenazine biosynthesis protein n=1 Tax=Oryzobacter telluris TaxID=3149179 RepID=UPI00370D3087
MTAEVLRYAAFPDNGSGGNPAGVVLDSAALTDSQMLAIAQTLGYSETAFLATTGSGSEPVRTRYFSPRAEVDFCGHATIAAAVAIAERSGVGPLLLTTNAGPVDVITQQDEGAITATLTSPPTTTQAADDETLCVALEALRISSSDLDEQYPAHISFAGNHHLVLGLGNRAVLDALDYDYPALEHLMSQQSWTTVHLFWAEHPTLFHARNPFPPGGVREDPATGAAAAAFGGYLRDLALAPVPSRVTIRQGLQMGAPSRLLVDISSDSRRVAVTGTAIQLPLSPYDELDLP